MEWGDSWHCPSSTVTLVQHFWFPAWGQGETRPYGGSLPLALGVWRGAGLWHPPGSVALAQGSQKPCRSCSASARPDLWAGVFL